MVVGRGSIRLAAICKILHTDPFNVEVDMYYKYINYYYYMGTFTFVSPPNKWFRLVKMGLLKIRLAV